MLTATDFTTVLRSLGAGSGLVLPAAVVALGATNALAMLGSNPNAVACWLATMTQESAFFRTTEEYAKNGSYAPYIGRTFQQVTWRGNYAAFGQWAADEGLIATPSLFVDKPELLAETQWAWLGGVWFFKAKNLWGPAIAGDFQKVQVTVNGASPFPAGWDSRLKAYQAWTKQIVKPASLAVGGLFDATTKKRLQQWIGVAMDGDFGSVSYSALQRWLGRPGDGTFSKGGRTWCGSRWMKSTGHASSCGRAVARPYP